MAFTNRTKISEYDATAANNINLGTAASPAARLGEYGVDLDAEAMRPSDTNGALRELMAHLKAMDAGTSVLTSPKAGQFLLEAISASITATAVDVFVYDTSKDSDGGAWRKRCQHTSWYNETLNTATRGSRREFPAVAVIVAEAGKVTIYDGDDPALPMWMVFDAISWNRMIYGYSPSDPLKTVSAANGVFVAATGNGTNDSGLSKVNFISDSGMLYRGASRTYNGDISQRNAGLGTSLLDASVGIVNNSVNDVAMTVLPDAPIDPATGLPVPTIAVATDGNGTYSTSVITDDGTVYDIASDSTGTAVSVAFDGVSLSAVRSDGTVYVWDNAGSITADGASPDATYSTSSTPALRGTVSKVAA